MFGQKDKNQSNELNSATNRIEAVKTALEHIQASAKKALEILRTSDFDDQQLITSLEEIGASADSSGVESVIEGVFNGEHMIGPDGAEYPIPANYVSKSKLVEGDMLKLTITKNGSFIYKQIGPIARQQHVATLARNEATYEWFAVTDENRWKLITAAVTYYHGQPGDEVVVLTPKGTPSGWAAVENVIKR